jgi:hypothetical protein
MFISLKLSEQLKKSSLICDALLHRLVKVGKTTEGDLFAVSEKMLNLAKTFDLTFPGQRNLRVIHYPQIDKLF